MVAKASAETPRADPAKPRAPDPGAPARERSPAGRPPAPARTTSTGSPPPRPHPGAAAGSARGRGAARWADRAYESASLLFGRPPPDGRESTAGFSINRGDCSCFARASCSFVPVPPRRPAGAIPTRLRRPRLRKTSSPRRETDSSPWCGTRWRELRSISSTTTPPITRWRRRARASALREPARP